MDVDNDSEELDSEDLDESGGMSWASLCMCISSLCGRNHLRIHQPVKLTTHLIANIVKLLVLLVILEWCQYFWKIRLHYLKNSCSWLIMSCSISKYLMNTVFQNELTSFFALRSVTRVNSKRETHVCTAWIVNICIIIYLTGKTWSCIV